MVEVSLTFPELLFVMTAYIIGRVIGEVTVLMFREWNYRRGYEMRNRNAL